MKIYFKNFNSLRAIAALLVLVSHIEQQKTDAGLLNFSRFNLVPLGSISVTLFFVLSGFLICYLLILEHENSKINLKYFYLRRVLKIWPLYLLVLLVAVFMFNDTVASSVWYYCLFFLPNIPFINHELPDIIDPIWSIGIEEQFYFFLPFLFFFKKVKHVFYFIVALFLLIIALRFYSIYSDFILLRSYLYFARFDCMLLGAVGAFLVFFARKSEVIYLTILNILYSKNLQLLAFFSVLAYILGCTVFNLPIIHLVFAILFLIILINLGTNDSSIINIENSLLNKIGIVSYGLYLTHKFVVFLVIKYVSVNSFVLENGLIYSISILASILLAFALYYLYEIRFIKLKNRFSVILKHKK